MDFKDRVAADIKKVFLRNKNFAETVNINDKKVDVVIDNDALKERNLAIIKSGKLLEDDILFFCDKSDFTKIPIPERHMDFNENRYRITSVADDMGILTITLARFRGA